MYSTGSGSRDRYPGKYIETAAQLCRGGVRKDKVHLELNLTRDAKNNKQGFYRYVRRKRRSKKAYCALVSKTGKLVTGVRRRLRYSTNTCLSLHWQPLFPPLLSGWTSRRGLGEQILPHGKRRSGS